MPSLYTGDPVATQAPATTPEPGWAPAANLPVDGEARNVLSIYQPLKVLADGVAWLFRPRAKSQAWAQPIMTYLSARQHKRFSIDHHGAPAGKLLHWRECGNFLYEGALHNVVVGPSVTPTPLGGGWTAAALQQNAGTPASKVESKDPDLTFRPLSRYVLLQPGATAGDYAMLYRSGQARFHSNNVVSMEWDAAVANFDNAAEYVCGFNQSQSPQAGGGFLAALFRWNSGAVGWQAEVSDGLGGLVQVDTGVVPALAASLAFDRLRIEWHGGSAGDDPAGHRVRFFINNTLVHTAVAALPLNGKAAPFFCTRDTNGTSTAPVMYVGMPITFNANTWLDAV